MTDLFVRASLGLARVPDLDGIREILKRVQEILTIGGVALAGVVSLAFVLTWVFTHLRRPTEKCRPAIAWMALATSYLPVALTAVAATGVFVPFLRPFILKAFALAVLLGAFTWCLAVAAVLAGGSRRDLARARRAVLLAGTPWYCLALYLATYL